MSHDPLAREVLLDSYRNPQNNQVPEKFTHKHQIFNRTCGDEVTIYLTIENNLIKQINYEIRGCGLSIASASILSEELVGMDLDDLGKKDRSWLEEILQTKLSTSRVKCALLPLRGIQVTANVRDESAGL
jgi:nitrogen fixation protein NifU and related proteins